MSYVYITAEGLNRGPTYRVGFYAPDNINGGMKFEVESDWLDKEKAANRVHYLNGGALEGQGELLAVEVGS